MKDRKLISLLKHLDKKDWKRFLSFVDSGYFNTSQKTQDLCLYYWSCFPSFTPSQTSDEASHAALYPGQPFNAHEINRYTSKLHGLLKQFLVQQAFEESPIYQDYLLEEKLFSIKAYGHFERQNKVTKRVIDKQSPLSSKLYFYAYLNQKLSYNYYRQHKASKEVLGLFKEASKALDHYYLVELFQASATLLFNGEEAELKEVMPLLEMAMHVVETDVGTYAPLIQLWYLANKLLLNRMDRTVYVSLKKVLLENIDEFPPLDARNMFPFLRKTAQEQLKSQREILFQEWFDLYEIEAEKGLMYAGNVLPYTQLNNIINIALKLKKLDWAEQFLEQSKTFLVPEYREDIYNFNFANIAFHRGDFSTCLKVLLEVHFQGPKMALVAKRLQLKCFYDKGDFEAFPQVLNAFRVYLHRIGQIDGMEQFSKSNAQFANFINALFKIKVDQRDTAKLVSIKEEVLALPTLPEYDWLLEKIRDFA